MIPWGCYSSGTTIGTIISRIYIEVFLFISACAIFFLLCWQGVYVTSVAVKFGGYWLVEYFLIVIFLGPSSKVGHTCSILVISGSHGLVKDKIQGTVLHI